MVTMSTTLNDLDLYTRLTEAGTAYAAASAEQRRTRAALTPLIREALTADVPPSIITQLSTLSPETVRTERIAARLPPRPRGGTRPTTPTSPGKETVPAA